MPPPRRDHALTNMHIFDDAAYLRDALGLPASTSEDDVDAQLALQARESGIEDPYRFLCPVQDTSRALSTTTIGSAHSSSLSVRSHHTHSTGVTDPSRTSRDQSHVHVKRQPPQQTTPTLARASIAHDSTMDYFPATFKQRHSTASAFSAAPSVSSSASSLPKNSTRSKRASFLSMFRRDSSSCTSPSHHRHHGKARGPKLACGHSLSPNATRAHIKEALQAKAVPNCCGVPLPRATLEAVLTKEETDRVLEGIVQSPELSSLRDSGYSENGMSSIDLPRPAQKIPLPAVSKSVPNTPPRRVSLQLPNGNPVLATEALQSFKAQQREQFERVAAFENNQRKALQAHHEWSLKRLAAQHNNDRDEREEHVSEVTPHDCTNLAYTIQHILELEELEDAQITAEDSLRNAQDIETQNVATALKHMEAYCLSSNPDHGLVHTVTQDDFKKLDCQRLFKQSLPQKHASAINVLRSRQERAMKLKMQKQEAELAEMDAGYGKEKAAEEWRYAQDSERLAAVIEARRKRLQQRWDLKFEMWRRDWESQHGTQFENLDWPLKTQYGGAICGIPESSETTTPIHAAA
ncbi:IBR domain-containing protein [Stagonosporopsis vannaccii]|nr:IBR domain-containing protein [Stagonosporopsis vannaccii]